MNLTRLSCRLDNISKQIAARRSGEVFLPQSEWHSQTRAELAISDQHIADLRKQHSDDHEFYNALRSTLLGPDIRDRLRPEFRKMLDAGSLADLQTLYSMIAIRNP